MKKLLLSVLLLTHGLFSFAQITVPASTFPTIKDTLRYATDSRPSAALNAIFTPPGGSQTWDLSTLVERSISELIYRAASTGKNVSAFPGADLVLVTGLQETYYNVTNTRFENMGYAGKDPFGLNVNILFQSRPPLAERRAPQRFFDINQLTSDFSQSISIKDLPDVIKKNIPGVDAIDSVRIRLTTRRTDLVDGYGTLKLPFAQYPVLREKRTEYRQKAIDAHTFLGWIELPRDLLVNAGLGELLATDTLTSYHFFNDRSKEVIAQVNLNNDLNQVTSVQFKAAPRKTVATREVLSPVAQLQLFPNPTSEVLLLNFQSLVSEQLTIGIFDDLGRLLQDGIIPAGRGQNTQWPIAIQHLPNGLYTLVLSAGEKMEAQRFIVLH